GTLRSEVEPYRDRGVGVILEIDVQGAEQVRRQCPDAVSVFLRAPSLGVYEQRLRKRGTETEEAIARRVAGARRELERVGEYDFQVVNDDLEAAVGELYAVVRFVSSREGQGMLDELKEEAIVNKVGGRFKLSTLIQKRMVALNTGARPLVDVKGGDRLQTVVQEILQDKIYLDLEGNLKTREAYEADGNNVSPSQAGTLED